MTKRITKPTIVNVSIEQAQEASKQYSKASKRLETIEAKMNEEMDKVRTKYESEITSLKASLEEPVNVLEAYAKEQKNSWGDKKSLELTHCVIGFRIGTPKVDKSSKMTWPGIVAIMKNLKPLKDFVRVKEEINKEAILACKDAKVLNKLKELTTVNITQEEKFFVDAKKEEVVA